MRSAYFKETAGLVEACTSVVTQLHRPAAGAVVSCAFLDGRLVSAAVRVEENEVAPRPAQVYGSLQLLEQWLPSDAVNRFLRDLAAGTAAIHGLAFPVAKSGGYLERELSNTRSGWAEWYCRMQFERSTQRSDVERDLSRDPVVAFGRAPYLSALHAVNEWVFGDHRSWSTNSVRTDDVSLRIPDTRARFTATAWLPGAVRLQSQINVPPQSVELQIRYLGSRTTPAVVLAGGESIEQSVPDDAEGIVAYLVHQTGDLLATASLGHWSQSSPVEDDEGHLTAAQRAEKDIAEGESQYVEFKEFVKLKEPKESELERTLVAFANTGGGRLYLGVRDDRTLHGAVAAKEAGKESDVERAITALARRLEREIANWVKPEKPHIIINRLEVTGNPVLMVHVEPGEQVYSTSDETICVRRGATSAKASISEIRELFDRFQGRRAYAVSRVPTQR